MDIIFILFAAVFAIIFLGVIIFFIKVVSAGKATISLEKNLYAQGETVKGKVKLDLTKEIEPTSATVSLIGTGKSTTLVGLKPKQVTKVVHRSSNPFEVQSKYAVGQSEADFQIIIPNNALGIGKVDASNLGGVGSAINFVQDIAVSKPTWVIQVDIKTKSGLILSGKTPVQVH